MEQIRTRMQQWWSGRHEVAGTGMTAVELTKVAVSYDDIALIMKQHVDKRMDRTDALLTDTQNTMEILRKGVDELNDSVAEIRKTLAADHQYPHRTATGW